MQVTVDRIENGIAVLLIRPEEEHVLEVPVQYLPDNVREGDILAVEFTRLVKETEAARERVESLIEKLKRKQNKGE